MAAGRWLKALEQHWFSWFMDGDGVVVTFELTENGARGGCGALAGGSQS